MSYSKGAATRQAPWKAEPRRLWSLLEMLRPYARIYLDPVRYCTDIAQIIGDKSGALDPDAAKLVAHQVGVFIDHARYADLEMAVVSAMRLRRLLEAERGAFAAEVRPALLDFVQRIHDELSVRRFLYVNNQVAPYYEQPLSGWGDVSDKLPPVIGDIEEAGKCLALGRATACVFHLMRVMEIGLKQLADQIGIPYAPSWESYIHQINTRIAEKHKKKGIRWKRDEHYFKEIAGDLLTVKVAWRNPTMHIVRTYTPEEAEQVFEAVRTLMQRIAARGA